MALIEAMRKFSVFSTNNIDEAETILCKSLVDAQVMRVHNRDRFGFQLNQFSLGSVSFVGTRYEAYTEVESGESGIHDNSMHLIFGGSVTSEFSINDESYPVSPTKGVVLVPRKKIRVKRNAGSEILVMRFTQSSLGKYYEKFLDQQFADHIAFQSDVNLTKGPGAFLKQLAINLLYEIQQDDKVIRHELTKKSFEELLLGTLLQLPHSAAKNFSQRRVADVAPRSVIRAEEYMRAHLAEPIIISDLLSICGCSRSVLYSCFKKTRGYTPMEFLAEQRLQKARRDIMNSSPEETISSIALQCGFSHLGRFSQLYRKRFGELPSVTPRK